MDEAKEKTLNLNASDVEACRICLGTDIKLHSLQDTALGTCMASIGGFTKSFEGLPNYVCYECAPILIKCNKLIEKSKTADLALLEIFNKNGQVNKPLIEEEKKSKTMLQTSLDSYLLLNYYYIKYDDDTNTGNCIKIESDPSKKISIKLKKEMKEESEEEVSDSEILKMFLSKVDEMADELSKEDEMTKDLSKENEMTIGLSKEDGMHSDSDVETIEVDVPVIKIESDDEKMDDDFINLKADDLKMNNPDGLLAKTDKVPLYNKPKKIRPIGMTPKEKGKKKKKKSRPVEPPTRYREDKFGSGRQRRRYFNMQGKVINKKYCKFCPDTYEYVKDARDHVIIGCQKPSSNKDRPRGDHKLLELGYF